MEEKSNVFIDNYFDKNERTRQESVKNPQIKHHNVKFWYLPHILGGELSLYPPVVHLTWTTFLHEHSYVFCSNV